MTDHIRHSVSIKVKWLQDPFEQGLHKILNYGHTLGHAIETHFLEHPTKKACCMVRPLRLG